MRILLTGANLKHNFEGICQTVIPTNISDLLTTTMLMNLGALYDGWDIIFEFYKWT